MPNTASSLEGTKTMMNKMIMTAAAALALMAGSLTGCLDSDANWVWESKSKAAPLTAAQEKVQQQQSAMYAARMRAYLANQTSAERAADERRAAQA
jgi:hypothetical protein